MDPDAPPAMTAAEDDIRKAEPNKASSSNEPPEQITADKKAADGAEGGQAPEEQAPEKPAPGGLLAKLGLDVPTFLTMFKCAVLL